MYKKYTLFFLMCLVGSLLHLPNTLCAQVSTSWQDVKLSGQGKIVIYYNPITHFIVKNSAGKMEGIEYELMQEFVRFTEKNYGVKLKVEYRYFESFAPLFDSILVAPNGSFAVSSMSITPRRLRQLKCSPPYMPDTEIIINSQNVPIVKDSAEFVRRFNGMVALVIRNTTYEYNMKKLKETLLPNLRIEYVKETKEIKKRMNNEPNIMAYTQVARYLAFRQGGFLMNRQKLFQIKKVGRGVFFPKTSDWDEPVQVFFNDPSFKPFINKVIRKYLGTNEQDIFWKLSNQNNPNQQEMALLNKEKELQFLELRRQKNEIIAHNSMRNYLIAGFIIAIVIALTFYYRFHIKKQTAEILKQKNKEISEQRGQLEKQTGALKYIAEELENQRDTIEDKNKLLVHHNKKITDSIRSAKAIQKAILPLEDKLEANFSEHFVFYKPKDIVSGDFYWLSDVNIDDKHERGQQKTLKYSAPSAIPFDPLSGYNLSEEQAGENAKYTFIAVVDCTGHGVPGAFMSMIGFAYLNQIVNENHILDPAEVLQTLHVEIHNSLKQAETNNDEGMDVCLCRVEALPNGEYEVKFAGAKRPLFYITNGALYEIRGNAASIGGWQRQMQKNFKTKTIRLAKGDILYLSSDGFIDTPNPERKNFGTPQLKELIKDNSRLPLKQQAEALKEALKAHQRDADQRDDITLLGIKF
ncbi:SpoIIE family protein phosphatase [Microscilla marina]|uniref:Serine/threonine protein kinases n=1 Tax=Microscilla marina ATCC 23134 TaxID=313606 RepID=A1ZSD8_MICM2|nr:SpoIIE family protein phosphatase [Microscilla marina]EAY26686.1 serine/threonine protein kinases [Microscilla marina ATCC 23134]